MTTKTNQAQLVKRIEDASIEQLDELIKTFNEQREQLINAQVTTQHKIDYANFKELMDKVKSLILPQLTFDIKLSTSVHKFVEYVEDATHGRVTITAAEFKHMLYAISTTQFKGAESAVVLSQLSEAMNNASKQIREQETQIQLNAELLDKALSQKDMLVQNAELQKEDTQAADTQA